jgi:hypothetical protein
MTVNNKKKDYPNAGIPKQPSNNNSENPLKTELE